MATFRVGQKVVVRDASATWPLHHTPFQMREVVTISGLWDDHVHIEEYPEYRDAAGFTVTAWRASRFRPAVSIESDLSLFRKALLPSPERLDLIREELDGLR